MFPGSGDPGIDAYGQPVYTYDESPFPDSDQYITPSYYTITNKVKFTVYCTGDGNSIDYPFIKLMFNGNIINVAEDLDSEISDTQVVYVNVEYGKPIDLYVEDRLVERYEVEWLDSNILIYRTNG